MPINVHMLMYEVIQQRFMGMIDGFFFSPLEDLTFGVKPLIGVIFNKFDLVIQVFF